MLNRLTDTLNFQTQALILRSERQRLLASNIANADTPGYQAKDLDFARALREAGAAPADAMQTTHAAHVTRPAGARAEAQLMYATSSQDSIDQNTVDMDRERAAAAENAVKYEATLRFINSHVRAMLDAMRNPQQG